ncbi:ArsR/SmtB family transcription factor [Rhodothermus bifroesti]|uniref:Transcriptional regulator n=1 Tax=Rhodothermus marinus TaxID=29549 RepID=A0A7V2F7H7_RHOMR|nr:metalloregulator ArsR/SmtB family transcription factor [Rhodothermus bifroesti]
MLLEKASTAVALKAKLFRGFADPSRLVLLEVLRQGPQTVTALVEATGLTQPNVSNHLRCLLDCGLVRRSRRGRFVVYRLSDERIAELLQLAEQVLADVARGVYHCTRYNVP